MQTIKHAINELKKDIKCYLGIGEKSLDDIPAMKYPDGVEPTKTKPYIQYASKGARIRYKRR